MALPPELANRGYLVGVRFYGERFIVDVACPHDAATPPRITLKKMPVLPQTEWAAYAFPEGDIRDLELVCDGLPHAYLGGDWRPWIHWIELWVDGKIITPFGRFYVKA